MPVKTEDYNSESKVVQYIVSNNNDSLVVKIINYGATITNILVNDKNGNQRDVVLGFNDLDGYLGKYGRNPYFGASIGRVANRIGAGKFALNGQNYQLAINNGPNSLHGGIKGFDKKMWTLLRKSDDSVTFELLADDGEEGYPGSIRIELTYRVTDNSELQIEYLAELDKNESKQTIINLTNHTYFNLNGCTNKDELSILKHCVRMNASHFLEVSDDLVPTGKILSTKADSPAMDFSENAHTIGERIGLIKPNGYDHCYVIETNESKFNIGGGDEVRELAAITSPVTGITLTFSSSEPAFQFYTANFLTDEQKVKNNQCSEPLSLGKNSGFCLESQRFPNAINNEKWKNQVILSPNEIYKQKTVYKFSL